jgi:hypothetical protein
LGATGCLGGGAGGDYPAQLAVAMGQEPAADRHRDAPQNQQFIADYQAGQDHEGQAAEHQRRAGRHAANDYLEGWPDQRSQAEHEQADPAIQTMPFRLESLAPNSRAVSFCAAPNSVRA